jgi:uncharacterized protein YjbJ (UPF0337 family)
LAQAIRPSAQSPLLSDLLLFFNSISCPSFATVRNLAAGDRAAYNREKGRRKKNSERRNVMNVERFQGQWLKIRGDIQKAFGKLTKDDLDVINGQYDKLVGVLEKKYGLAKDEIEKKVEKILH